MPTLAAYGCSFDSDGMTITASINGAVVGSCAVSGARTLEGGGVYLDAGTFHAVLTDREFAQLLGEVVEPEPAAPVAAEIPAAEPTPKPAKARTRRA